MRLRLCKAAAVIILAIESLAVLVYTLGGVFSLFCTPVRDLVPSLVAVLVFACFLILPGVAGVMLLRDRLSGSTLAIFWQVLQIGVSVSLFISGSLLVGILGVFLAILAGWALLAWRVGKNQSTDSL